MNTIRNVFTENASMSTQFSRRIKKNIRSYDHTNTIPVEIWI